MAKRAGWLVSEPAKSAHTSAAAEECKAVTHPFDRPVLRELNTAWNQEVLSIQI